jgi:hypothetical protein
MTQITQAISALSTPPSRTDPATFDDRADQFLAELPGLADEVNTLAGEMNTVASEVNSHKAAAESAEAGAVAAAGISAWDADTPYVAGDTKYGSDGHSYRAVQASTGVDPVTDSGENWTRITQSASGGFRNRIINGLLRINQRGFDGNWADLSVGDYGYDRWRKAAAGQMEQIVEADNIEPGLHTITWSGGGDGMVAGVDVVSGSSVIVPSGNVSVVVPTRATRIQLEPGPFATPFELRPVQTELQLCQWYYESTYNHGTPPGTPTLAGAIRVEERNVSRTMHQSRLAFIAAKRIVPTITFYSPTTGAAGKVYDDILKGDIGVERYEASVAGLHTVSLAAKATQSASEACWLNFHFIADAEI